MKWINELKDSNLSYYTYKLNQNDSAILFENSKNNSKCVIVLYGTLYIKKIFRNNKKIPIIVLHENHIFQTNNNKQFYYKLIALEKTYIISTKINIKNKNNAINIKLIHHIIESYNKTLRIHECINEILRQKRTNKRIIQTIVSLLLNHNRVKRTQIYVPFKLSNRELSSISQTNEGTTSRVMRKIKYKSNIKNSLNRSMQDKELFNLKVQ